MQDLRKTEFQSADWGVCQQIHEGSKPEEAARVKVRLVLPAQRPGGVEERTGR